MISARPSLATTLSLLLPLVAACAGDPPRAEADVAREDAAPAEAPAASLDEAPVEAPADPSEPEADAHAPAQGPPLAAEELPPEWQAADRMLAALGGREAWAELAAIELHGDTYLETSEQPIPVRVWRDLEHGLARIEQTFEGTTTVSVVGPERGWTSTADTFAEMSAEQLASARHAQERTPYRLFRALARREGVRPRVVESGLEIYSDEDGSFLGWTELGPDDLPRRYGYSIPGSADREFFFDAWAETGGYVHPTHYTESSQGLRFAIDEFLPHTELPRELFEPPVR